MALPKRPPLPVILVANDLVDGEVVFRSAKGWSSDHRDALIAGNAEAAEALEAEGAAEMAANKVVDAYLVDVTLGDSGPMPRHYRERLRTLGPSIRTDLGKQADTVIRAGSSHHVSL
jgi:sulfite reductase (NADPH) hemoprotein beta-component